MELRKEDTEHNKLEQGTLATVTGNTCKENMEQVRVLDYNKTPETGTWNVSKEHMYVRSAELLNALNRDPAHMQ
jgi:hypothetical protein